MGRRTKFIWLSLRNLVFELIHPEREEPLPNDHVEAAAGDLNTIYINIRGALDNFAWSLLALFGEPGTQKLASERPTIVSLFGREFAKDGNLSEVADLMGAFTGWSKDLKARRDPAAHRIPLSIVPALIDDATVGEYTRLQKKWSEVSAAAINAVARGEDSSALFQEADAVHERLQRVGKFHPLFGHDPSEGLMKIYPVVPQDIAELVRVSRILTSFITAKISGRANLIRVVEQRAGRYSNVIPAQAGIHARHRTGPL